MWIRKIKIKTTGFHYVGCGITIKLHNFHVIRLTFLFIVNVDYFFNFHQKMVYERESDIKNIPTGFKIIFIYHENNNKLELITIC